MRVEIFQFATKLNAKPSMALHNYIYTKHEDPNKNKIARPSDPRPQPIKLEKESGSVSRDMDGCEKPHRISVNMVDEVGSKICIGQGVHENCEKVKSKPIVEDAKEKWVIIDGKRRRLRSRFSEKVFERRKSEARI